MGRPDGARADVERPAVDQGKSGKHCDAHELRCRPGLREKNMMSDAMDVDYQEIFRKHASRIGQQTLDAYPDLSSVPIIEELPDSPRGKSIKLGKGKGLGGGVVKKALKDKKVRKALPAPPTAPPAATPPCHDRR